MKRRTVFLLAAAAAAVLLVVGLVVFKPWLLFVDVRVDDALPPTATTQPTPLAPSASSTPSPAAALDLAAGSFVSHEHDTSGSVRVVQQTDGSLVLAIENLATSNGPDVHVWLSASDVVEGSDGWYTAGGADHFDLGVIKGNLGNQLYDIPADVDLSHYASVDLWCEQFSVSFGAAQLVRSA